jgi:hypothetical protein
MKTLIALDENGDRFRAKTLIAVCEIPQYGNQGSYTAPILGWRCAPSADAKHRLFCRYPFAALRAPAASGGPAAAPLASGEQ